MTTWVMGDLHGQYNALMQVFDRAGFDYKNDRLIFLGDVMDRGNESFECMAEILRIENRMLIVGNHDVGFANYLAPGVDAYVGQIPAYIRQQWTSLDGAIQAKVVEFLSLQVPYFIDEEHRCFIHGGFEHNRNVHEQPEKNFIYDRTLWSEALHCHPDRIATKDGFSEIFIGHTPTLNFGTTTPMFKAGIWNLDTGAGFEGGKLTLMNLETKDYVQSDPVSVEN